MAVPWLPQSISLLGFTLPQLVMGHVWALQYLVLGLARFLQVPRGDVYAHFCFLGFLGFFGVGVAAAITH